MDWQQAVGEAYDSRVDKDAIRNSVSLQAVCEVELDLRFDTGAADCPFHDDHGKNFTVFGDDPERSACWVCQWRGDVFDVIMAARECSFTQAIKIAAQHADDGLIADESRILRRPLMTPEAWQVIITAAQRNALDNSLPVAMFINEKNLRLPTSWLIDEWRVGVRGAIGTIIIPHFNELGEPVGYKERTAATVPIAAKGSRLTSLYGVWRDQGRKRVFICEGESDTWTVSWVLRNHDIDVMGLPTGAGSRITETTLTRLNNRDVLIAFDGDAAGREASSRWLQELSSVTMLQLPDGADCSSVDPKFILRAVA